MKKRNKFKLILEKFLRKKPKKFTHKKLKIKQINNKIKYKKINFFLNKTRKKSLRRYSKLVISNINIYLMKLMILIFSYVISNRTYKFKLKKKKYFFMDNTNINIIVLNI